MSWIRIGNFVMCSTLGGFAGVLTASASARPTRCRAARILHVLRCRRRGHRRHGPDGRLRHRDRYIIGVAVLTVLNNGFTLIGTDAFYNDLFIGAAILLSMGLGFVIARVRGRPA